jgi:high-affinity Fe2+/Pb2+ permease
METETKSHDDGWLGTALLILAAVLIPNVLHDHARLPLSWGYVLGFAVASTLGYFFLTAPKKNVGRFVLITIGLCAFGYLVGRFLG